VLPAPCAIRVARTKRPSCRVPLVKTRDQPRRGERPGGSVSRFRQRATPWSVPARQSVIRLARRVSVSATSPNGADGVNDVPRSKPSGIGAGTGFGTPDAADKDQPSGQ
jgi:hypothetical protein